MLITHDMGVVADIADRIAVMRNGIIVESGHRREMFHNPQHEYTIQLLAAVPHLGPVTDAATGEWTSCDSGRRRPRGDPAPIRSDRAGGSRMPPPWRGRGSSRRVEPILELIDVAIEYPKQGRAPAFRAVEGANLVIYPGEVVGLVGESGSGKTTIGRAAVGLLPVAAGTMRRRRPNMSGPSRRSSRDCGMTSASCSRTRPPP